MVILINYFRNHMGRMVQMTKLEVRNYFIDILNDKLFLALYASWKTGRLVNLLSPLPQLFSFWISTTYWVNFRIILASSVVLVCLV